MVLRSTSTSARRLARGRWSGAQFLFTGQSRIARPRIQNAFDLCPVEFLAPVKFTSQQHHQLPVLLDDIPRPLPQSARGP
jgi:hypothetical protein